MQQYRKKPVVIEAYQIPCERFLTDKHKADVTREIAHWCGGTAHAIQNPAKLEIQHRITIRTLEGEMTAGDGDWIIKGVKGEFYPCKPDIFEATYVAEEDYSDNPVAETKQLRKDLDDIIQRIRKSKRASAERTLSLRSVQVGVMWLGMDLKDLNEPNPYPESYNPASPKIEPTADGLKL